MLADALEHLVRGIVDSPEERALTPLTSAVMIFPLVGREP